jgi:hypothetical protein
MVNAVKDADTVSAEARQSAIKDIRSRTTLSLFLLFSIGLLVFADSFRARTPTEKVSSAQLIVRGVATLDGLPLAPTQHPVKRSCNIVVLETLWPTNQPAMKLIVVDRWVWTKWPDTWWNYNSKTGIYFFIRTTTAVEQERARVKQRYPEGLLKIDDNFFGTNTWTPLERFDDWYEPTTNVTEIQRLIEKVKK